MHRKKEQFLFFYPYKEIKPYMMNIKNYNKGGPGLGLQLNYNTKCFIEPLLELYVDIIGNFEKLIL